MKIHFCQWFMQRIFLLLLLMLMLLLCFFYTKNTFKYHYRGYSDTLLANTFERFFRFVLNINYALGACASGHVLVYTFIRVHCE